LLSQQCIQRLLIVTNVREKLQHSAITMAIDCRQRMTSCTTLAVAEESKEAGKSPWISAAFRPRSLTAGSLSPARAC
ncbi:MAG: hypothetical protein ACXABY_04475, partial [Candidatus Thorarchaeota archaeon]